MWLRRARMPPQTRSSQAGAQRGFAWFMKSIANACSTAWSSRMFLGCPSATNTRRMSSNEMIDDKASSSSSARASLLKQARR